MSESEQNDYTKLYVIRQEQLLHEHMRKAIDAEIKASMVTKSLQEMQAKYEESQKQVEIANDMMQQATNGLEKLTLDKKSLEDKLNNFEEERKISEEGLRDKANKFNITIGEQSTKIKELTNEIAGLTSNNNGFKKEVDRLNLDVNNYHKRNEELQATNNDLLLKLKQLEDELIKEKEKNINKGKKSKSVYTEESSEDSTF